VIKLVEIKFGQGQAAALIQLLSECFRNSVNARSEQIDGKYKQWQDNYDAVPKQRVRSKPFTGASNFVPQLIRMHTDILSARVSGIIFATRPMWQPTTFRDDVPAQAMNALAQWMQYISQSRIQLPQKIDLLIHSCFKSGTQVLKDQWLDDVRYLGASGEGGTIRESSVKKSDMRLSVVPFEDFFPYPLTSLTMEDVQIKFHRIRLTKQDVERRKSEKRWQSDACDLLLKMPDGNGGSLNQQQAMLNQGLTLTKDVGRPFSIIEAHLDYELSSGKLFPIVVVFNPFIIGEVALLRAYYQPGSDPFSTPFTDFRLFPSDKNFYTACVPSILEDSQEEQAQIHNSRRDASAIANVPGWKKKRYSDTGRPSDEWYPGKVWELDSMDDLAPLVFGVNYNSMVEEESFLLQLAERYTGVTPASQGQGAGVNGKRGVYANTGTLAMLAESNRRLDTYIKRVRLPFHVLGTKIYRSYRDFGDADEFAKWGGNAELVAKLFQGDQVLGGSGTFFDIAASDSGANRETDRSGLLLMANTMSAYYHEIVQAAQMVAAAPQGSPVRELLLQIVDGARDLADRILFHFNIDSRSRLLPDLRAVLGGGMPAPGQPGQAAQAGSSSALPEPQGSVSPEQLQQLSGQLGQLAGQNSEGRPQ